MFGWGIPPNSRNHAFNPLQPPRSVAENVVLSEGGDGGRRRIFSKPAHASRPAAGRGCARRRRRRGRYNQDLISPSASTAAASAAAMTPVSQSTTESLTMKSLILILFVGAAVAQDDIEFSGPKFNFRCPEPNGKFRDPEQCDLYYECEDNEFNALLCDDGLLFDDRDPIQRKKIGFTFGLKNSLRFCYIKH